MNTGLMSRRNASLVAQVSIVGLLLIYLVAQSWNNPMHRAFWVAMFLTALVMGGAIGLAAYVKSSFARRLARYLHSRHGSSVYIIVLLTFATSRLWRHSLGDEFFSDVVLCILSLVLILFSFTYFTGALAEKSIGQREAG